MSIRPRGREASIIWSTITPRPKCGPHPAAHWPGCKVGIRRPFTLKRSWGEKSAISRFWSRSA
jgi:hypothetical protein